MEPLQQNTNKPLPLETLFSSLIIYCSQYPYQKPIGLLKSFLHHPNLIIQNYQTIKLVLDEYLENLTRQTVHGPSGSYIPVQDKPHQQYLNLGCIFQQNTEIIDANSVKEFVKQQKLDSIIELQRIQELLWYNKNFYLKKQQFIHKKLSKNITKYLNIEGQCWNQSAAFPTLLISLKLTLEEIISILQKHFQNQIPSDFKEMYLFLARINFIHNKILKMPTKILYQQVIGNYKKYFNILKKKSVDREASCKKLQLNEYISILLQYMHALGFYYKYREAETILEHCQTLANVSLEYTGKLGRRTKYQSFDTAQLIMNFKEAKKKEIQESNDNEQKLEDDLVDIPSAIDLVNQQLKMEHKEGKTLIEYSQFDEQSILLQKPLIVQESMEQTVEITEIKLLVSLCALEYKYKTTPKDEMLFQQISTALIQMLSHGEKVSYPILFNMLFLRSENEFNRVKNAERALGQFQVLKTNYNEKPANQKNDKYTLSTDYKIYLEFINHLADKYLSLGMVMTAVELYQQVGMYEECIDGLIARNYRDKAKQKIFNILNRNSKTNQQVHDYEKIEKDNRNKTPRLLCMLGDIVKSNPKLSLELYMQAWQLSEHKFARAQRSIGWHFYAEKNYQQAAIAFKKATSVNYYNPNTWFTLGCCYMSIKQFQKALSAFSESISIDSTQGQAWGNIASCYMHMNKYKQAYSTLSQAVKYSQRNWKLWANLLTVSLKTQKFYKYFECVQQIVSLEKNEIVTFQILQKISVIFRHYQESVARRHSILAMQNRINRLFQNLLTHIGQVSFLWRAIYYYHVEQENFVIANFHHYTKIHQEGTIKDYDSDIIEGYEKYDEIKKFANAQLFDIYNNILDCKMTEVNMTMKVGWDSSKNIAEDVLVQIREYIWVWNKFFPKVSKHDQYDIEQKHNKVEHELFIEGVRKKLQNCIERKIELSPKQM